MANTVTISSAEELSRYKTTILSNLRKSVQDIKAMIDKKSSNISNLTRLPPSLYLENPRT